MSKKSKYTGAPEQRCKHPDCIYRLPDACGTDHHCGYALATGHSRNIGLKGKARWPVNCKKYISANDPKAPKVLTRQDPVHNMPLPPLKKKPFPAWYAQAAALAKEGMTNKQIGEELKMSPKTVLSALNKMDIKYNPTPTLAKLLDWDKAYQLWKDGLCDREIGEAIGCSAQAVNTWRHNNGYGSNFVGNRRKPHPAPAK